MTVRVYEDKSDGSHEVWLELDRKYSGVCIGAGRTRDEAVEDATSELHGFIAELESALADPAVVTQGSDRGADS